MQKLQKVRTISARLPLRLRLALVSFGLLSVLLTALGLLVSFTIEETLLANQAVTLHEEVQLALAPMKGSPLALTNNPAGTAFSPGTPSASENALPSPTIADPSPGFLVAARTLVQRLTGVNIRATLLSPQGTSVIMSEALPFVPPSVAPNAASVRQALLQPQAIDTYTLATASDGQRQLIVLLPVMEATHVVGLLEISTPTALIDNSLATIRLIMTLGILLALGIAAALTIPLIGAALRPLVAMERISASIAEGAFSERLDIPPTSDEIGHLARSFNHMVMRLEAAFAQQKQFVADVSHELRTPLTALGGGIEMLLLGADQGDREAARHLLHSLYAEIKRMQRLVEDLLTLTRLDAAHTQLRIEMIHIESVVEEVCEQTRRMASGHTIQAIVAADLPAIHADSDRLRQVLLNIVDNALKFTSPAGRIELRVQNEPAGGVIIQVQDTGSGIPPEALPHIFDRFYRVDPARTRSPRRGGNGLGLAIAKELIEMHDGKITVSSELEHGTTFTIRLPDTEAKGPHARLVS